jgi:anti-sigma B factor antagonist
LRFSSLLTLRVEPREDARMVRLTGELDVRTAGQLRAALDSARADGITVLVDMAGVSFIDAVGLDVLLHASNAANDQHWAWFLVRPSTAVLNLLEISGTASRLPLVVTPGMDRSLI